ncbi:MAG TPA: hypothetical protein HPP66_06105 [Planctomycetes bacterium]|nr:hypothetical protein [Planctomycetota bacterium]
MYRKKSLQSERPGFAVVLVMCAVVILLVIGGGVLSLGLHTRELAVRTSSEIAARCAADAGVTKAFFEMNEKLKVIPWSGSVLPEATNEVLPNSGAAYSYTVAGDLSSGYVLTSTGKSGVREKIISCSLLLKGPFEHTILTQGALILKAGTLVRGCNSADPWDTNIEVLIGTKSILPDSVILNSGVVVNGSVVIGVGGDVETVIKDLGASTYRQYAMVEEIELPVITAPELTDMGSGINVHGTTLTVGPVDNGQYGEIEVKRAANPGILEVNGGDVVLYVTGDISLGQECQIVIKDGSSLVLYLDGDMDAANDAGINNESLPTSLKIFGTSTEEQSFTLKAKSESLGAIYAPNATVTIMADGDIYGSVTAKSFELKSGGNFYYDKALREVTPEDDAVEFVIREWREE